MRVLLPLLLAAPLIAQTSPCSGAPIWAACDWTFELAPSENPDSFDLHAEFRSPHSRTILLHAFRDSDRRFVIRFAPTEEGDWNYRLTSNLQRLEGQTGRFNAASSA